MRAIIAIIVLFIVVQCTQPASDVITTRQFINVSTPIQLHRITVSDHVVINHQGYSIIMVDSVEYITNGNGGICPLVKN